MRPIPQKLRQEMARDPYYSKCAVTGERPPKTRLEWHHALQYAGRQVSEKFCILPLSHEMHERARNKEVKEFLLWIAVCRASEAEIKRYNLGFDCVRLIQKFGIYDPNKRYEI